MVERMAAQHIICSHRAIVRALRAGHLREGRSAQLQYIATVSSQKSAETRRRAAYRDAMVTPRGAVTCVLLSALVLLGTARRESRVRRVEARPSI
jgi:hypothetical protein